MNEDQPQQPDPELGARLNRSEIRLCKAIDNMALSVDELPGPYWFSEVFAGYMSKQTTIRRDEIRAMLAAALDVLDNPDRFQPQAQSTPPNPQPDQQAT